MTKDEATMREKGREAAQRFVEACEHDPSLLLRLQEAEAAYDACEHDWQPDPQGLAYYTVCTKCNWSAFDAAQYANDFGLELTVEAIEDVDEA